MFGTILTKRRAKLLAKKMTDQAELRLHLRDEHLREGSVMDRLKRKTTSHRPTEDQTIGQSSGVTTSNSDFISPNHPPPSSGDSDIDMSDLDGDDTIQGSSGDATRRSSTRSFSSIARDLSREAQNAELEDDLADTDSDSEPAIQPPGTANANLRPSKTPLKTLFDFSNTYWSTISSSTATSNLEDEMELHQLLDLDAEGDPDDFEEGNDLTHPSML